jgi:SAM-dependent methyltransferase
MLFRRLARSIETNGLRGAIAHARQRLAGSLRNHGLGGSLARAFRKAPPAPVTQELPHPFDLLHGTDTGGYIGWEDLASSAFSNSYSTVYFAISPSALTQALSHLPFPLDKFTFVDLGCGKGRAVMVAANFPFHHVLGVELTPDFCRIAEANIATNPAWAKRISIVNQDAADFSYPDTPLVIFLYQPFLAPVLRRVLANLQRQLRRTPRETYLLYADNPRYTEVLDQFPFLRELSDTAYPLSQEDAAAQLTDITQERFTLYSADPIVPATIRTDRA